MTSTGVADLGTVALLSLEPWDDTWRRNQHLAARLVTLGLVRRLWFVAPSVKLRRVPTTTPFEGVRVTTPTRLLPHHRGGAKQVGLQLIAQGIRRADVLWINDAPLGAQLLTPGQRTLYDVTDDWRSASQSVLDRGALIRSEDRLATRATTTVCSPVLAERWSQRYGVAAQVIQNGVDLAGHRRACPVTLPGDGPHAVYVGTLHPERLDIGLIERLAVTVPMAIHLVGPDCLGLEARARLRGLPNVYLHPPVGHEQVPSVLAAADVLLCPHVIDDFTLSLDAIKSFEYLASRRPVVATASSGFQALPEGPLFRVVPTGDFVAAVQEVLQMSPDTSPAPVAPSDIDWDDRARSFAVALAEARRA